MNDISTVNAAGAVQMRLVNLCNCIDRLHRNKGGKDEGWDRIRELSRDLALSLAEKASCFHKDIRSVDDTMTALGELWHTR